MRTKFFIVLGLLLASFHVFAEFSIADLKWVNSVGSNEVPLGKVVYDIKDYGAISDHKTLNTKAIQATIDDCEKSGGGIVLISPGTYLTGSIYLKDGVHLHISEDATLLGSENIADYPEIDTRVAGIEMKWPSALINVIGKSNVLISGKGEINGQGKVFWDTYWKMRREYESKGLRWIVDYDCKRPRTILISDSKDITVRDLTLKQAGFWTIHLLYSSHCTIDGVIIKNNIDGHGPSTDGIDIDSSTHILVENCDIDCNDDNFCLKAGRDADGLRVNRPTEYIVIRNCISRAGGGLFTCGSETSGGIRHVLAYNLKAKGTKVGLRFKSAVNRGGVTEHIYLKDIEMESVGIAIEANMNWNPSYSYSTLPKEYEGKSLPDHWRKMLQKVSPPELAIPYFRNIYFSNITVNKSKIALNMEGFEKSKLESFNFNHVAINAESAGKVKYGENWKINQVEINTMDGNPVFVSLSEDVTFPSK